MAQLGFCYICSPGISHNSREAKSSLLPCVSAFQLQELGLQLQLDSIPLQIQNADCYLLTTAHKQISSLPIA